MTLSQFQEPHFEVCSCALLDPAGQGQRKKAKDLLEMVLKVSSSPAY